MKRLFLWTAALWFLLDQLTKAWVVRELQLHQSVPLPGGILSLTYIHNQGGAFGLFPGAAPLFLLSGALVAGGSLWALPRLAGWGLWVTLWCGMILGGTLGNSLDRIRLGWVVDFLDLGWWPVFNVADIGISVGITALMVHTLRLPPEAGGSPDTGAVGPSPEGSAPPGGR